MKSILFTAPMILALRDGKKDVTRRLKTKLKAGDLVYVKEAWRAWQGWDSIPPSQIGDYGPRQYEADGAVYGGKNDWGRLRSPIHMPEWASRFRLRIVDVRKERLMDITADEIRREGLSPGPILGCPEFDEEQQLHARWQFLWDRINGEGSTYLNPEVYRIEFRKEEP